MTKLGVGRYSVGGFAEYPNVGHTYPPVEHVRNPGVARSRNERGNLEVWTVAIPRECPAGGSSRQLFLFPPARTIVFGMVWYGYGGWYGQWPLTYGKCLTPARIP